MFLIYPFVNRVVTISDCIYEYLVNPNGYSHVNWKEKRRVETVYLIPEVLKNERVVGLSAQRKLYVYERFLSNLRVVFARTLFLGEAVRQAVFTVDVHLFKTYLKNFEKALQNEDYKAYLSTCFTD